MNRIADSIYKMELQIQDRIAKGLTTSERVEETRKALDMDAVEFVHIQELKSLAFATGKLTQEEAQYVYSLLGLTPETFNKRDVATKAVLTQLFKELLEARIRESSGGKAPRKRI